MYDIDDDEDDDEDDDDEYDEPVRRRRWSLEFIVLIENNRDIIVNLKNIDTICKMYNPQWTKNILT